MIYSIEDILETITGGNPGIYNNSYRGDGMHNEPSFCVIFHIFITIYTLVN